MTPPPPPVARPRARVARPAEVHRQADAHWAAVVGLSRGAARPARRRRQLSYRGPG